MAWSVRRMRLAFAPFSGLTTMAGIAMMIVFGTKYVQHRNALDDASPGSSAPALVTRVTEMTCTTSARTSIQAFNVRQRCLEIYADVETAPAHRESRRIVVLESDAGRLAPGDQVYVLAAPSAIGGALIINAQDDFGFFLRQYSSAALALLGALLLAGSFLVKRGLDDLSADVGGR